jgi:hypothetical protein
MPRIRTIDPHFPQTPSLSRISREARLFFILLWTVADDSGRLRLDHERLRERLYPFDDDVPPLLPVWIGELEVARCVELYRVDDVEYLRVRKWREVQTCIQHPSRSRLPAAPHEAHEPHEESVPTPMAPGSKAAPHEGVFSREDIELPGTPGEFSPQRVLDILEIALRKSMATDAQTATARYIELAGRKAGLWKGQDAPARPRRRPSDDPPTVCRPFWHRFRRFIFSGNRGRSTG